MLGWRTGNRKFTRVRTVPEVRHRLRISLVPEIPLSSGKARRSSETLAELERNY